MYKKFKFKLFLIYIFKCNLINFFKNISKVNRLILCLCLFYQMIIYDFKINDKNILNYD